MQAQATIYYNPLLFTVRIKLSSSKGYLQFDVSEDFNNKAEARGFAAKAADRLEAKGYTVEQIVVRSQQMAA